jgi:chemotaxis protein MotB
MTARVVEAVVLKPHDKAHDQTIVKRGGGKHKHDDHGGAWKVAFADFCLALMLPVPGAVADGGT